MPRRRKRYQRKKQVGSNPLLAGLSVAQALKPVTLLDNIINTATNNRVDNSLKKTKAGRALRKIGQFFKNIGFGYDGGQYGGCGQVVGSNIRVN